MWVSLVSLFLDFREEHCLSPDLSSLRVGMQNQTFCLDLVSMHRLGMLVAQPGGK